MPIRDISGIPSYNPTKDTHQVTIINPPSVPIETTTKDTSHVSKQLKRNTKRKIPIEPTSGYPTSAPITILIEIQIIHPTGNPSTITTGLSSAYTDSRPSDDPYFGPTMIELNIQTMI